MYNIHILQCWISWTTSTYLIRAGKERFASMHFDQYAAETPHVDGKVVRQTKKYLRWSIETTLYVLIDLSASAVSINDTAHQVTLTQQQADWNCMTQLITFCQEEPNPKTVVFSRSTTSNSLPFDLHNVVNVNTFKSILFGHIYWQIDDYLLYITPECVTAVYKFYFEHKLETAADTHPFNGPLSRTTPVSRAKKATPIWILLKQETVSGSAISGPCNSFYSLGHFRTYLENSGLPCHGNCCMLMTWQW